MKKVILFSSATALFIGGVFAVESLASCESHMGRCKNQRNDCIGTSSDCGELCYAEGYKGPGYMIHE